MEVWDALTLKLLSTLQSPGATTRFRRGLAYSPDGRSLAGCSDAAIVIWDTQTGGVVKKIGCEVTGSGLELLWSVDGRTIGTASVQALQALTVHTYDVASGTALSPGTLQLGVRPYIWAHGESFRIATTTASDRGSCRIKIFEVGATLTEIESFPFRFHSNLGPFSPTTYRISVSVAGDHNRPSELLILDVRSSEVLLKETGDYRYLTFSPDGSSFAAFNGDRLFVWIYASEGRYTQWRVFRQAPLPLQFSPTSSSILGCAGPLLRALYLDYSLVEPVVATRSRPQDAFSPDGTFIVTAHRGEKTVTITNLRPQNPSPSQFIETDLEISTMVLTGNVLLVKDSLDTVVAWLLTSKGVVDGIFGNTRADRNDSLWDLSPQVLTDRWARLLGRGGGDEDRHLGFSVEDGVAAIKLNERVIRVYRTGTGEIVESTGTPLHLRSTWYRLNDRQRDECDLYHRDLCKQRQPSERDWPVSQDTLREGWVKDAEGKHRLWLHGRWRSDGNDVDWLHNVTTLRLRNASELVIVKF